MSYYPAIRVCGWMAVACLVEGWLAGASLLASCGDYVVVGGQNRHGMSGHSTGHGLAPFSVLEGADAGRSASSDRAGETPCRGPHCSRRSIPDPGAPTTVSVNQHDWGMSAADRPIFSVQFLGAARFEARPRPLYQPGVVFRPPRSV